MPGAAVCCRRGSHVCVRGVALSSYSFSFPLIGKRTKTILPPRARNFCTAAAVLRKRAPIASPIRFSNTSFGMKLGGGGGLKRRDHRLLTFSCRRPGCAHCSTIHARRSRSTEQK